MGWAYGRDIIYVESEVSKMNDYEIVSVRGHYEIYLGSMFICSADTYEEAEEEIEELKNE